MLVNQILVAASQGRAKKSKIAEEIHKKAGEAPRASNAPQREARLATLLAESSNPVVARTQLERLIGGNDLVGVSYLERGVLTARSVCRVRLRDAAGQTIGYGTGFLVAPGVLMTNHHVIGSAATAASAIAEFNYELDVAGNQKEVVEFAILAEPAPIPVQDLDFCLAAVATTSRDGRRSLDEFAWLTLDPTPGKAFVGEYLTIVPHPGGERKQVCVRENQRPPLQATRKLSPAGLSGSGSKAGFAREFGLGVCLDLRCCGRTRAPNGLEALDRRLGKANIELSGTTAVRSA